MRVGLMCLLLPFALGAAAPSAAAQVYRWVDGEGKVHFSDRAPTAPGAQDVRVKSYEGAASISVVPRGADSTGSASVQSVTLLTTRWCGICKQAKAYLKKMGVAFLEHDVEASTVGKREYERLGGKGVPIILVGDRRMNGFDRVTLEGMLKRAGILNAP